MLVTPHTAEDDIILFSALKSVDAGYLHILVEFFLERTAELHVRYDVGALTFIRCDNTDLMRKNSGLEELSDDFLDV